MDRKKVGIFQRFLCNSFCALSKHLDLSLTIEYYEKTYLTIVFQPGLHFFYTVLPKNIYNYRTYSRISRGFLDNFLIRKVVGRRIKVYKMEEILCFTFETL